MAVLDKKKIEKIDLLANIKPPKTDTVSFLDPPDRKTITDQSIRDTLSPAQRALTHPVIDKAVSFLTGGMSPEEADQGAYESVKRWAEIPGQAVDVGKFLTRPFIPEKMGGRPNTFTDFADAAHSGFGVMAAPFIPTIGAMTSAIHSPDKTLPGIVQSAIKGGIHPESSPSLFHGLNIKGIGTDTPLTEWERGGSTKAGAVGRMIPRATMQAVEMVTLGYMLGIPRATKRAIKGRIGELKAEGMERDFNRMFEKEISPDMVMTQLKKQGIIPRKGTMTPETAKQFRQMVEDRIEYTKNMMKTDPRVGEYFAKKQTPGKIYRENVMDPMAMMKDKSGQLKFSKREGPKVPLKSNLQAVIDAKIPNKVAAGQAMNTIRNSGVSPEEIEFSGLGKFLEENPNPTKQEILDHVEGNKVKLETVVKGSKEIADQNEYRINQVSSKEFEVIENDGDSLIGTYNTEDAAMQAIGDRIGSDASQNTKFETYTLPGGENYKEVLIKLPEPLGTPSARMDLGEPTEYDPITQVEEIQNITGADLRMEDRDVEKVLIYPKGGYIYKMKNGEYWTEAFNDDFASHSLDAVEQWFRNHYGEEIGIKPHGFTESHWEEPNVLAHLRTKDRKDSDGKKTLFIEEIQSDWHLQGKKRGYDVKKSFKREDLTVEHDKTIGQWLINVPGLKIPFHFPTKVLAEKNIDGVLKDLQEGKIKMGDVPDAPFKKSWHELGLKKAIEMAVEGGYEKVSWVTGDQTRDRYDLSKQVDTLGWNKETENMMAFKDEKKIIDQRVTDSQLESYVGKDVAKRLRESKANKHGQVLLQGEELSVGGKWANTFYDQILPKTAQKYIKKWGGKVEELEIDTSSVKYISSEMAKNNLAIGKDIYAEFPDGGERQMKSIDEISKISKGSGGAKFYLDDESGMAKKQLGFAITPQMVKEVKEIGQPMFGTRLASPIGSMDFLKEKRGMAGTEGTEPLPDDVEGKPGIFDFLTGGKGKPPKKPPKKTKQPEPEDEWEKADAELTKKIDAMSKKKQTSREQSELFGIVKDVKSSSIDLSAAVKQIGGIKPYANKKEMEEYKAIPQKYQNSKGMTLDEAVAEINNQGFNFADAEDLRQALIESKGKPEALTTELADLVEQFEIEKDIWLGNQDVRITLEIPAEKRKIQDSFKAATGNKHYGDREKQLDMAVQLYIDNKRNPGQVKELYDKLTDEQKKIVDLSNNLPEDVKAIATRIQNSYKKIGLEAKDEGVIRNVLDNYAGRIWDIKKKGPSTEKFRKFGKTTRHAKERVFDTIVEGWSKGLELRVKGASNNLAILKEEIVKTIEDKKFIEALKKVKDMDGNPLLTTKQLPGYKRIEHPNFTTWGHAGKAVPGEVYGRNSFVSETGDLFEKKELYAPTDEAVNLNNILGVSKLKGTMGGVTDVATKYNAIFKAWVLQTSLFHHLAFSRSYYLGTNRKTFREMNIIDAVNDGNRMIDEMSPVIVHGVRSGLTLGRKQDWQEDLLKEKTAIGAVLDKWKVSKATKDKILDLRQQQADFLFGVMGTGLKAKAYVIEFRNQSKKYPHEDPDVLAKRVAGLINDDFGGLHLKRLGRNPTTQHIFRLLALAPDWTESNIRTMVIALTPEQITWNPRTKGFNWTDKKKLEWRKQEREFYGDFWAGILAKGIAGTLMANLATAAFDEDDVNGKGVLERFVRNYKTAWNAGKYKWLDIDITPLYKAFGGTEDARYYFSILGHFKDPFKLSIRNDSAKRGQRAATFKLGNTRAMKHKSSIVGSMTLDYLSGTDYAERRYTTIKELIGKDEEKGEYKTTRKGVYKKGDPKWGKLKGQTVTWDPYGHKGSVELEQMPSYLLNKARNTQPIQVQQLMGYMAGELSGFLAIGNALGLGVRKSYPQEPEQMSKKAWRDVPLNDKKVYEGKKYIKDHGLWREVIIKKKRKRAYKSEKKDDKKKGGDAKSRISDETWKKVDALIAN